MGASPAPGGKLCNTGDRSSAMLVAEIQIVVGIEQDAVHAARMLIRPAEIAGRADHIPAVGSFPAGANGPVLVAKLALNVLHGPVQGGLRVADDLAVLALYTVLEPIDGVHRARVKWEPRVGQRQGQFSVAGYYGQRADLRHLMFHE